MLHHGGRPVGLAAGIREGDRGFVADLTEGACVGKRQLQGPQFHERTSGAAMGRIDNHPVDGAATGTTPDDAVTAVAPGRRIEPVLQEPRERLAGTAEFRTLSKPSDAASERRRRRCRQRGAEEIALSVAWTALSTRAPASREDLPGPGQEIPSPHTEHCPPTTPVSWALCRRVA